MYKITQENYRMISRERLYTGGLKYMCRIRLYRKKTMITFLRSFLKVSCHTKSRFTSTRRNVFWVNVVVELLLFVIRYDVVTTSTGAK